MAVETKTGIPTTQIKVPRWRCLRWPSLTLDLSRPRHRRKLFLILLVFALVGSGILYVGYKGFHYVESAEFCGSLCHAMQTEFVRYEISAHAQVECAQCHVGAGVMYFVQSKINGVKSLYYAISNTYERPIKSPVHDLRPARETCEECHTPNSYTDNTIKTILHFDSDEANTPVQSTLILKMGGWQEDRGISHGIHWHITNPVYYIAADEQRQVILWVGAEMADGTLQEYYSRDMLTMAQTSFVEKASANGDMRRMDCIDCHNRSAHAIAPPDEVVDNALERGDLPQDLPYIRAKAVEVLTPLYANNAEAYAAIEGLLTYYRVNHPEVYRYRLSEIEGVCRELEALYDETNFPEMKLNWQTNPDNERHSPFPGCFRCHDDKHARLDPAGNTVEVISAECNLCHTVPIVGRGNKMLIEAPVIAGAIPPSHATFRFTIDHRSTTEEERQECYQCHGQAFCSNEACHSLEHPPDMLFTHSDEYRRTGDQVCYTCHQDILCSRCHPGGVVGNP